MLCEERSKGEMRKCPYAPFEYTLGEQSGATLGTKYVDRVPCAGHSSGDLHHLIGEENLSGKAVVVIRHVGTVTTVAG